MPAVQRTNPPAPAKAACEVPALPAADPGRAWRPRPEAWPSVEPSAHPPDKIPIA
jgi:hypothetical protein